MAEEDPWAFDEGDVQPEPAAPAPAAGEAGGSADAAGRPEEEVPQSGDSGEYRKPITLYKHWVRPQFLQYNYMYDYRTNYYDDVIEYLDKKNRGLKPTVPRAQTWAERVLRTHTRQHRPMETYTPPKKTDSKLIQTLSSSIKGHNYHSRAYISRKYSSIL
ncbi:flightin isoform X2 [Phlebotomus papatasi]|uniref:flightin isoform X2 n=1 Tax=Phlebotomus papatasi TaxID=29031 RepID=UPI0024842487|nr:flightin isoform X2 [Phlebotomus papatasi]XP_055701492.1 flightin isoform X2 [Phlebotomus papatasi]XP_055701493.1 flightin isoform X2 [Phlebotomus papatasi]XP_055701494.1 flightin isoform X2 [Phlebotomus papatasi]